MAVATWGPLAGGASTLSKYPDQFPATAPREVVAARGCRVEDAGGRQWIDWTASLGAVLLGYAQPVVTGAVRAHLLEGGPSWPLAHPLEAAVAARLRALCGEPDGQVRFVKSGSEACAAAVRLARAATGRDLIVSCGFHGWHDPFVAAVPPAWGVPAALAGLVRTLPYGDLAAAEALFFGLAHDGDYDGRPYRWGNREDTTCHGELIAAVVAEPVTLAPPAPAFLAGLRRLCDRYRALLVFDETITGGRYPAFTAGRHYGVRPDLTVLGKGIANGWPLAAVVGPRVVMRALEGDWRPEGPVFVSGTYGGETGALAAAAATLELWETQRVAAYLHRAGQHTYDRLQPAITALAPGRVALRGQPYRWLLEVLEPDGTAMDWGGLTLLRQELAWRGILVGTGFTLMAAHRLADLEETVEAWEESLAILATAWAAGDVGARLAGPVCRPPYRQG